MFEDIILAQNTVREKMPLIHCITNPISINQCANAVLAIGARPVMAEHPDEAEEITSSASALLLNLGNITQQRMAAMLKSAYTAKKKNIPVVLDLVGVACSRLRRCFAEELLDVCSPVVVKGNYSEICAMCDKSYSGSGVDADKFLDLKFAEKVSAMLSQKLGSVVLASGKTDVVCEGKKLININNGCTQLSQITGTGCMLGALTACFLSVTDGITASLAACGVLGISGERAKTDSGNGSFLTYLIDSLSLIDEGEIRKYLRFEVKEYEKN